MCVCLWEWEFFKSEELVKVSLFIVTRETRCSHSNWSVYPLKGWTYNFTIQNHSSSRFDEGAVDAKSTFWYKQFQVQRPQKEQGKIDMAVVFSLFWVAQAYFIVLHWSTECILQCFVGRQKSKVKNHWVRSFDRTTIRVWHPSMVHTCSNYINLV